MSWIIFLKPSYTVFLKKSHCLDSYVWQSDFLAVINFCDRLIAHPTANLQLVYAQQVFGYTFEFHSFESNFTGFLVIFLCYINNANLYTSVLDILALLSNWVFLFTFLSPFTISPVQFSVRYPGLLSVQLDVACTSSNPYPMLFVSSDFMSRCEFPKVNK